MNPLAQIEFKATLAEFRAVEIQASDLSGVMQLHCGKFMYGTIAIIANVALNRTDMTGRKIREMVRRSWE